MEKIRLWLYTGLLLLTAFAGGILYSNFTNHRLRNITPPGIAKMPLINPVGEQTVRLPILLYHYVEYNQDTRDTIRTSMSVTPYWFDLQMKYLQDNNYHTITFDQLYDNITQAKPLPANPVILTFDDGFRDFYTDAWPILKKYRMKATIFVVPGFLDKQNYLFTWQLSEIATESANLVTVGTHTMNHLNLTSVGQNTAYEEILKSKQVLEQTLGTAVDIFNYPYGGFTPQVTDLVKKAGFRMAVSTLEGNTGSVANLYSLPRIRIGNYAAGEFAAKLDGENLVK